MARVTVEDCIDKVPNRFELILLAAHRARIIAAGSEIAVEPVVSCRSRTLDLRPPAWPATTRA